MSQYAIRGIIPQNTLVGHVIAHGLSTIALSFSGQKYILPNQAAAENGVIDSLKYTLTQHVRPGNEAHEMLYNL